jgi:predicted transcriptional regulator
LAKRPALAKSELEIAQLVWQVGQATVRQVLEALPAQRGLDFKTVQTYLRRLEAKGYLRSRREGRARIYVARVQPEQVRREVINDFIHRLFGGETIPLFQHLINDRGLSDSEIGRLRELLDTLEARKP